MTERHSGSSSVGCDNCADNDNSDVFDQRCFA